MASMMRLAAFLNALVGSIGLLISTGSKTVELVSVGGECLGEVPPPAVDAGEGVAEGMNSGSVLKVMAD